MLSLSFELLCGNNNYSLNILPNFRYASRCLLIPFQLPQLTLPLSQYIKLVEAQKEISSRIGFFIGLGEKFLNKGIRG